jgi:Cytochrome c/c1 heme lyase
MGSGSSKPVETTTKSNQVTSSRTNVDGSQQRTPSSSTQVNVVDAASDVSTISSDNSSKESKCPMHRADGSYSFDWRALFQPAFPHGPSGKKPLTEEEARANLTRRLSCMDATMASPGTGCPIKEPQETIKSSTMFGGGGQGGGCPVNNGRQQQQHPEYNVYAQPIDPKNNMPQEANQLPAPGQTKPLSTDRVKSSIPKVRTLVYRFLQHLVRIF